MTTASVYILYSQNLNKFYIGFTSESVSERLRRHNTDYYDDKFTASGKPWVLFTHIECISTNQARKIEAHIKSMKSAKYIKNLMHYPEIILKLKTKYQNC